MMNLSRRILLQSLLASRRAAAFAQQAQPQNGVPGAESRSATRMWCAGRGNSPAHPSRPLPSQLPEPLEPAQFRRLPGHPLPPRAGAARLRRRPVPDAAVPPRLPLPAPGDGERHPRRRPDAGALPAGIVRLRPQQDRAAAAGQSRLCGLPPALPPQHAEGASTRSSPSSARAISASSGRTRNTASRRAASPSTWKGGEAEEFPHFREFWIQMPSRDTDRVTIFALLDSPSVAGAYRFVLYPSRETTLDITATLFPRQTIANLGLAPLTSMYLPGRERPEAHRRFPAGAARFGRPADAFRGRRVDLAALAQSGQEDDLVLQRQQPPRLRTDAARSGLRELPGPGGALPPAPRLLGRADRRMGRGPRRARRDPDPGRDARQHRGLLGAQPALRAGAGDQRLLPAARRSRRSAGCIRAERSSTPS